MYQKIIYGSKVGEDTGLGVKQRRRPRVSWGILGNDRLGDQRFLYLSSFNSGVPVVFGNNSLEQSIVEGRLGNQNVTWETVKKLDIGMDAIFYNGLLGVTIDYFHDKRTDIL